MCLVPQRHSPTRIARKKFDFREPWRGRITHWDVEGGDGKEWGPVRFAAKKKPHRPGKEEFSRK
jgi:hypothetical protein